MNSAKTEKSRPLPFMATVLWCCSMLMSCGGGGGGGGDAASRSQAQQADGVGDAFVNFETGQVRPLALSTDGSRLLVTNTPNATLDIFTTTDAGLMPVHSVPVGLEPVSVATNGDDEAWVVNHLSDSISVIDLSLEPPRVVKTLLVGDEPRDIIFAGPNRQYAFVTAANRGQNGPDDNPIDPQLQTPGTGRADLWVFDATNTGASVGGDPLSVTTYFSNPFRSLASNADGSVIYASVMHSGNRTTAIGENGIAKAGPTISHDGVPQPDTGLIVQYDGTAWRDETASDTDLRGTRYDELVPFSLPDYDLFELSAEPVPTVVHRVSGIGTTLYNMAVNTSSGAIYVSNTEALNVNRFEGHSELASNITGNFAQSRIAIVDSNGTTAVNLNSHLDHSLAQASADERNLSVAQPLGLALSADNSQLYVAAFASSKIAVYNTDDIARGSIINSPQTQIRLDDGGPTAIVVDSRRNRLYVLTRFNNRVSVIDAENLQEINTAALHNPEPQIVKAGRQFLYDASATSSHGDSSCGLCHVFGDTDALAWDLGNPDGNVDINPNAFVNRFLQPEGNAIFHPLKGPMATQSLRGLANAGPMHWRGDRTGANAANDESLEMAAFKEFNAAFPELLGRERPLSDAEIHKFAEFALTITYPPNPIRQLDNGLTESQSRGRDIYMNNATTGEIFTCNDCHVLDPASGHFGTSGLSSVEGDDISQEFKVPHLRNMYQKAGKFGNSGRFSSSNGDFGPQVSGFGFMHDGNMDTLDNFFQGDVFRFDPDPATNTAMRQDVVNFVMAFDSNLAPVVGQQVTLSDATGPDADRRAELLIQRALITAPREECDLIAKGVTEGKSRGYLMQSDGTFTSDTSELLDYPALRARAMQDNGAITLTCVPPGSGRWMGVDRNLDGVADGVSTTVDQAQKRGN